MLDRENDDCVVLFRIEDGVRVLRRERATNARQDLDKRLRALRDVRNGLSYSGSKAPGNDFGLSPIPPSSFRKLGARFRPDDDPALQSLPKTSRSTDSQV